MWCILWNFPSILLVNHDEIKLVWLSSGCYWLPRSLNVFFSSSYDPWLIFTCQFNMVIKRSNNSLALTYLLPMPTWCFPYLMLWYLLLCSFHFLVMSSSIPHLIHHFFLRSLICLLNVRGTLRKLSILTWCGSVPLYLWNTIGYACTTLVLCIFDSLCGIYMWLWLLCTTCGTCSYLKPKCSYSMEWFLTWFVYWC